MNLLEQLTALVTLIADLQTKLADAQAAADELAKAKYDEGFAAGVASVSGNADKIYSQAELDAKIAEAMLPVQEQVAALQAQVDGFPQMLADKMAEFKAELSAKYQEMLVVENNAETGFAELLK